MVEESIVFSGEISDRSLDKSADKVEDRFSEAGQIDVDADTDGLDLGLDGFGDRDTSGPEDGMSKMDAAMLAVQQQTLKFQKQSAMEDVERNQILNEWGAALMDIRDRIPALAEGGGFAEGGDAPIPIGDGGGGLGAGGGAAAGLASRIPKPIAGVGAAAVLPVGLAGGIGAGMLAAMHSSSARLQTSTTLIGQAWNNVWRPLGDKLDQLFIRDLAVDLVGKTEDLGDAIRDMDLGQISGSLMDILFEGETGITSTMVMTALFPGSLGANIVGRIGNEITSVNWGQLRKDLASRLPDISPRLVTGGIGWPTLTQAAITGPIGWPTIGAGMIAGRVGWPDVGTGDIVGRIDWPSISSSEIVDAVTGGGGNGGGGDDDFFGVDIPFLQGGGRIERTGVARVHRGELVADPDRLVSELASAVQGASSGGGGADVSGVERKLDQLNRNVKRLASAMDNQELVLNNERVGRAVTQSQTDTVSDVDPTV